MSPNPIWARVVTRAPVFVTYIKAPHILMSLMLLIPSLKNGLELVYNRQPVTAVFRADSPRGLTAVGLTVLSGGGIGRPILR